MIILNKFVIFDQFWSFLSNFCSFLEIFCTFLLIFCRNMNNLHRISSTACGSGELPKPRGAGLPLAQHRKIVDIPWVSEGCSLPRQRPTEAGRGHALVAGRGWRPRAKMCQNHAESADFCWRFAEMCRNWSENEQKLIRNDQNWSELTKWSNYRLINN